MSVKVDQPIPIQRSLFGDRLEEPDPIEALNELGAVHRWYNYVQDFPSSLIWNKLREYGVRKGQLVLDPFVGSGTSLVCAKMRSLDSVGVEASPLMAFVSKVKTNWELDPSSTARRASELIHDARSRINRSPGEQIQLQIPQKSLNKWLNPSIQKEAAVVRQLLLRMRPGATRDFLFLAFGRAAFKSSNVKLCPGVTFIKNRKVAPLLVNLEAQVATMVEDLRLVQGFDSYGHANVIVADARKLCSALGTRSIDFLITSPPYPGDVEYTRQTRLEMYLLGFVHDLPDVQQIKKIMLRSSVKNIWKQDQNENLVKRFRSIIRISDEIQTRVKDKDWGWDYPRMVREYFGDMLLCLAEFRKVMKPRGHCLLIVGDQTVKGVVIPVGKILCSIGKRVGFRSAKVELFRVRRSSTHSIGLRENIVVLEA